MLQDKNAPPESWPLGLYSILPLDTQTRMHQPPNTQATLLVRLQEIKAIGRPLDIPVDLVLLHVENYDFLGKVDQKRSAVALYAATKVCDEFLQVLGDGGLLTLAQSFSDVYKCIPQQLQS